MLTPSRILITGASGFVGKYLIEQCRLCYPHATLYGIYRNLENAATDASEVHPIVADVRFAQSMHEAILQAQPELIFHLAAQSSVAMSWNEPAETLRVNAEGLINILEALHREKIAPRVIVIGSSEQYGMVASDEKPIKEERPMQPLNPYAIAKTAQDFFAYQYFVAYQLPIIRVRAFNHFGPGQAPVFVIASIARQIALIEAGKAEPVLHVGNLRVQRDFLAVEDIVKAYIAIAKHGREGEAYNVGSGKAHSIDEIMHLLLQQTSSAIQVQEDTARFRPTDQSLLLADVSRLNEHTGWKPSLDIEQALRQTLDYWRACV